MPCTLPFSHTTFPSTMVVTGHPLHFQPPKGVFFPFDKNSSGSIFSSLSMSRTTRSAAAPTFKVPTFSNPKLSAGFTVNKFTN